MDMIKSFSSYKYDVVTEGKGAVTIDLESRPPPKNEKRWIKGLLMCALAVALAFMAHLILTFQLASRAFSRGYKWDSSSAVVFGGDCDTANRAATGLHVLVNVIVLAITAASSYCCQVLSAPSRARIDVAHSQRVWVSIGSSSFTNIWYAPIWRKTLWLLVFASSIPVQMIYNSFVYVSIGATDFGILVAPQSFAEKVTGFNGTFDVSSDFQEIMGMSAQEMNAEITSGRWQELDGVSCAKAYSQSYQTSRADLVMFSEWEEITSLEPWKCDATTQGVQILANGSNSNGGNHPCELFVHDEWKQEGNSGSVITTGYLPREVNNFDVESSYPIQSCYSQQVDAYCELSCSLPIGITVIICIGLKLVCMIIAALERRQEIILTVGDAIASFLERPDPYTLNNCMMARSNKGQAKIGVVGYRNDYPWVSVFSKSVPFLHGRSPPPQPKRIHTASKSWRFGLPQRLRRFFVIFNVVIIILIVLLSTLIPKYIDGADYNASGMSSADQKINSIYHSKVSLLNGGFIATVLCVNAPQLVISIVYSVYNNTLTRLLLAAEFNKYAVERRPLRVSYPTGQQRGTYWLSIPYRYTIPFLTLFTLAHWLSSQAFSLVQIIPVTIEGDPDRSRMMLGVALSTVGVRIMAIPVLLALLAIIGLVMQRFQSAAMPIAMNCSAAISATCHPPADDMDAAQKPVMWGEVDVDVPSLTTNLGPGLEDWRTECRHCSFSSQEVRDPDPRIAYY